MLSIIPLVPEERTFADQSNIWVKWSSGTWSHVWLSLLMLLLSALAMLSTLAMLGEEMSLKKWEIDRVRVENLPRIKKQWRVPPGSQWLALDRTPSDVDGIRHPVWKSPSLLLHKRPPKIAGPCRDGISRWTVHRQNHNPRDTAVSHRSSALPSVFVLFVLVSWFYFAQELWGWTFCCTIE